MADVYIPDNYDMYKQHEREQEKALELLPRCTECNKRIQDDFYEIDDEIICAECMERNYKRRVDDYIL